RSRTARHGSGLLDPSVALTPLARSRSAFRRRPMFASVASVLQSIADDAPEGAKGIAQSDLLPFGIAPLPIRDRQFAQTDSGLSSELRRHLELDTEASF